VERFQEAGGASLKLPAGWFGRPYDNVHQLTAVTALAGRLVIALDSQMVLTLAHPATVTTELRKLTLSGFAHGTWDWDECASDRSHVEILDRGVVEFVCSRIDH
jgi:hypothetical protein